MKWITRERPKTDRIACPWLIRRFIDPEAEFIYVPKEQVLATAERTGGHSFDAPSAEYTHTTTTNGSERCTFETLIDAYGLGGNPALARLAKIVHAADVSTDVDADPAGRVCWPSASAVWMLEPTIIVSWTGQPSSTTRCTHGMNARPDNDSSEACSIDEKLSAAVRYVASCSLSSS